jgi:prepilin-type N-terminal cleavage/methylation domain-containing protein
MQHAPTNFIARSRAFTLVEVIIAIALMGITMTAALSAVAYAARDRRTTEELRRGNALAASLAREIQSQRFADPGGVTTIPVGPNRTAFNNVADYHGYAESPPVDRSGAAVPNSRGWRRSVAVERASVDSTSLAPSVTAATTVYLLKFTVTATSPSGKSYSVASYRSAFGVPDSPTPSTGFISELTISLQSGSQQDSVSVDLANQPNP